MKKKLLILLLFAIAFVSCKGQEDIEGQPFEMVNSIKVLSIEGDTVEIIGGATCHIHVYKNK